MQPSPPPDHTSAPDLSVTLCAAGKSDELRLALPLIAASGVWSPRTAASLSGLLDLGALVSPGIARTGRLAAASAWLAEAPAGVLTSGRYPTLAVQEVQHRLARTWESWPLPVIAGIAADSLSDAAALASRLDATPGVAALELDLTAASYDGAAHVWLDPTDVRAIVSATVRATALPVIAKLPAPAPGLAALARAATLAGASALTISGPMPALDLPPGRAARWGMLHGPATRPLVLARVYELAPRATVPLIACGGVATGADAIAYLRAGATAVQIGTTLLADPGAAARIQAEFRQLVTASGITTVSGLNAAARQP